MELVEELKTILPQCPQLCTYLKTISDKLQVDAYKCKDDHSPGDIFVISQVLLVLSYNQSGQLLDQTGGYDVNYCWLCPYYGTCIQCKNPLYLGRDDIVHLTVWSKGLTLDTKTLGNSKVLSQATMSGREVTYLLTVEELTELVKILTN